MTTTLQCNDEIFPGYILSDRLGSGGYAEVWRARAPGGIEKAIKFVYGYYDEELAAQEMKAMERIKDVRHPFLLSLERFEVVDGRLAILSELADMSLDQRARQCRADGHVGIPREELLRYMIDAAEALDFLGQKHGLQHLDVKPENLLVSGDHIKVADFGLVKELTTRTQNSLVAGMTPTYASPEMFDDMPSAHSDQYSLAIVYQEMLTGTLPFPGRTAAQLAKQHTQSEPQVMALPAQDRSIVTQALAKNPLERYPSCREFIEALKNPGHPGSSSPISPAAIAETPPAAKPPVAPPSVEVKRTLQRSDFSVPGETEQTSMRTTHRHAIERPVDVTQPIGRAQNDAALVTPTPAEICPEPEIAEEIVDVAVPCIEELANGPQPTLYVGIGGVGIQALCRLRGMLARRMDLDVVDHRVQMAALDTDRNELKEACSRRWKHPLLHEDALHLPLRLPKSYDEDCRESLAWLSRRWLYNIPRSLETRGFRPLGRVALVDHVPKVRSMLDKRIARLIGTTDSDIADSLPIRVVIISGMGGGTGTGMLIDVANAVRALAGARSTEIELHAFLLCTSIGQSNSSPLAVANTYALLNELTHSSELGNKGGAVAEGTQALFESSTRPFDAVYCVPTRGRSATSHPEDDLKSVVKYLAAEATTPAGAVLQACRQAHTEKESANPNELRLRTLGFESLKDEKRQLLNRLAANLGRAIKSNWFLLLAPAEGSKSASAPPSDPSDSPNAKQQPGANVESDPSCASQGFSAEGLRSKFGKHASTRFAGGIVAQIERRMASRDERGNASFTARQAQGVVAALAQSIGLLATNVTQANGDASSTAPSKDEAELVEWIAEGSHRVLSRLVGELDPAQVDAARVNELIDGLIVTECMELLEADLRQTPGSRVATMLTNSATDIAHTIERASTDLLKCGYDRRTLLFRPTGSSDISIAENLKSVRPLAAVIEAETDDEIVICEGSGISPRSLARRLERLYPGIADAARRLHTRIDINWQTL